MANIWLNLPYECDPYSIIFDIKLTQLPDIITFNLDSFLYLSIARANDDSIEKSSYNKNENSSIININSFPNDSLNMKAKKSSKDSNFKGP